MTYVRLTIGALVLAMAGLTLPGSRPAVGQSPVPGRPVDVFTQPRALYQNGPDLVNLASKPADAELHKLMQSEANYEREVAKLVADYGRTDSDTQRGKIKTQLAEVLDKQFDLQQKRRDAEVARIEAQLKKLRDVMRRRGEARQTIVEKRLDQLLREADGLGWTPPPGGVPLTNFQNRPATGYGFPQVR